MALIFPTSASVGQLYQSGSSATYQWNGTYWQISAPTTQTFVTATSASFATTSSYLATPTICLYGDLNQFSNTNTALYSAARIISASVLTNKFTIGNFTVSNAGIAPNESGFYEITYTGFGTDAGGNATVGYLMMGVNNAEVARTEVSHVALFRAGYNISLINQVNAGQLIDFRMGTSGGEAITLNNTTIIVKRVG